MSDIAVRVTNLSKRYRIGVREQGYKTFREAIVDAVKSPFSNLKNLRSLTKFSADDDEEDIIWALRDINFEVKRGEIVGIIGANGAGKSTLLKVLSRITEPTTGQAEIRGRVSSLLEVGTGFHPELTGRENIYLNGTVLGMRKKEIDRKFDEIVDFSGVAKFIDTPVKRYSSGMKVRLAFAVAAHLEPEILIIDEVLSVGDAVFQKKCLGKMGDVAKGGRTVLFVSHNMVAMNSLCERAILLENGKLIYQDVPQKVINKYYSNIKMYNSIQPLYGNKNLLSIKEIKIKNDHKNRNNFVDEDINIEIAYSLNKSKKNVSPNINIFNDKAELLFCSHQIQPINIVERRVYVSTCRIQKNFLQEGLYTLDFAIGTPNPLKTHVYLKQIFSFGVVETFSGKTARGLLKVKTPGVVAPLLEWKTEIKE